MGTWWGAAEIERFIDVLPKNTMLILDEAYGETAPADALPRIDVSRPNVLRMRTFSKAYGLAGMRCGYAVGAEKQILALRQNPQPFRHEQADTDSRPSSAKGSRLSQGGDCTDYRWT